jgi:1-acyl-sn-glycerol-3-phosphate acyltransferase
MADWPVLGYLAQGTDTLFLRRGDAGHAQLIAEHMAWRLRQGRRLMLFPEGTTTAGDRVLRFHPKLFQPARLAAATVQVAALQYRGDAAAVAPFIGDDEFLPHLWRLLHLPRIDVRLQFCPPLAHATAPAELARMARAQVLDALQFNKEERLPGHRRTGCY